MVTLKGVVCWMAPEVAVTVTVEVVVLGLDDPPQPAIRPVPIKATVKMTSICSRQRFLKSRRKSARASVAAQTRH